MEAALAQAHKALQKDWVPVGAVLCQGHTILQASHNTEHPLEHAEMNILQQLPKRIFKTCDLYVTLQPCPMCAYALYLMGIRRIYFGAYRHLTYTTDLPFPHMYGGILETPCQNLLTQYFSGKRTCSSLQTFAT